MTPRLIVVAAVLVLLGALGGCGAVPVLTATGAGASIWTAVKEADRGADAILAADAPIKHAICAEIPDKGPRLAAWCANIPTNVGSLVKQWAAVALVDEIERASP